MERYASTLATTAACCGLLFAGHLAIVHERASVPDEPVKVRHVATTAMSAQTTPWAEPPAKPALPIAETTGTVSADVPAAAPAPAAEPAAAVDAEPVVQAPVPHAALKQDKARRAAEQARRKKLAQAKERRTRTASRDLPADSASAPEPTPRAEPAPAPRVDPIGDLLRGLGIGRQG